ncbi:MAG TPA: flagellar biosynthesis protein FlgM, partial [Streptomyces sp.]
MRISGISTIVVAVALSAAATTAGAATLSSGQSADGQRHTSASRTSAPSPSAVVAAARAAALAHSAQTGIGRDNQLVATDVMIDASGTQHVRFHQTYRGIPVTGGDLIVHLRSDSSYLDVTRAAHSAVSVKTTTAKVTARQAKAKAARLVHGGT